MSKNPILEAVEDINSSFDQFKIHNDKRLDDIQERIEIAECLRLE